MWAFLFIHSHSRRVRTRLRADRLSHSHTHRRHNHKHPYYSTLIDPLRLFDVPLLWQERWLALNHTPRSRNLANLSSTTPFPPIYSPCLLNLQIFLALGSTARKASPASSLCFRISAGDIFFAPLSYPIFDHPHQREPLE